MTLRGRLVMACVAVAITPVPSALAQGMAPSTLPDATEWTINEAGGQLFWVSPPKGETVSLYTRPAAGGAARSLGTVSGMSGGADSVAFDGTRYAAILNADEEEESDVVDEDDCGVCEADVTYVRQLVVGTLDSAPRVLFSCRSGARLPEAAVAIAAGRTFFAGVGCDAPAGIGTVDAAGAVTVVDPDGTAPLKGAGNWLTYARKDATRVIDLVGSASYTVRAAFAKPPLLLQADGSIVLGSAFYRTGGTAPAVPVRAKWAGGIVTPNLFVGDRLFYSSLYDLPVATGQGPRALAVPALTPARPLQLTGSALDVAGYTCAGAVGVRSVDLAAPPAAAAANGCPVKITSGTLRLTKQRTISVRIRCVNGCSGRVALTTGNLAAYAKARVPAGGTATLRFRLSRKQAKSVGRQAKLEADSAWLSVDSRAHRLKRR